MREIGCPSCNGYGYHGHTNPNLGDRCSSCEGTGLACCEFAGLRGDYRCEGECKSVKEPMDYDEWVQKTKTIRAWVNHRTVSIVALLSELEFWLDEMSEGIKDGESSKP